MSALEEIRQAIDTLERLKGNAFPGPWRAFHSGVAGGDHSYVLLDNESILSVSANDGWDEAYRAPTADLVATLHRTIDAQLAILLWTLQKAHTFQTFPIGATEHAGLDLARAINRSAS